MKIFALLAVILPITIPTGSRVTALMHQAEKRSDAW